MIALKGVTLKFDKFVCLNKYVEDKVGISGSFDDFSELLSPWYTYSTEILVISPFLVGCPIKERRETLCC